MRQEIGKVGEGSLGEVSLDRILTKLYAVYQIDKRGEMMLDREDNMYKCARL